jgi:hypothetical protein
VPTVRCSHDRNEVDIVRPMDVRETDFSSGPLHFKPRGFLVAILPDQEEATEAVAALRACGFAERETRLYTGQPILADHQIYAARQGPMHR